MNNENEIKAVIIDFMLANELFTSVDISNQIKKSGTFIKNRTVASYLRKNWLDISNEIESDYRIEQIMVGENFDTSAILYLPFKSSINDYIKTNQKALTPDEAKEYKNGLVNAIFVKDNKDDNSNEEEDIENDEDTDDEEEEDSDSGFFDTTGREIKLGDYAIYLSSKYGKMRKGFVSKIYYGKTGKKQVQLCILRLDSNNSFRSFIVIKKSYDNLNNLVVTDNCPHPFGTSESFELSLRRDGFVRNLN